jgi:hypothetical protein
LFSDRNDAVRGAGYHNSLGPAFPNQFGQCVHFNFVDHLAVRFSISLPSQVVMANGDFGSTISGCQGLRSAFAKRARRAKRPNRYK